MNSFVYNYFSNLYLEDKIDLNKYISTQSFYVCLMKSKYTPNINHKSYYDIKSAECSDVDYKYKNITVSGSISGTVCTEKGSVYGSDVSWECDLNDIRYAVLFLKTSDENNGLLISCYDFGGSKSFTGIFTLSWNGVEILKITHNPVDVDRYVINLDTKTIYTPDLESPDDVYKGLTERKLYVKYSDDTESQLTLISLAGKIDDDPDDDDSIDNDKKDLIPDFVSYKVFEKYAKKIDQIESNFATSGFNFIGVVDGLDDSEVNFKSWIESHNHQGYKEGSAIIVSVIEKDNENPVPAEELDFWLLVSDSNPPIKIRCTPNDMLVCVKDASLDEEGNYIYDYDDWKFINSNTIDIISQETAVSPWDIPAFDSSGKLLASSGMNIKHEDGLYVINIAEPVMFVSGVLARKSPTGSIVEYLSKDQEEIRPVDAYEIAEALDMEFNSLFNRLSEEEIKNIKDRVDEAFESLGSKGMSMSTEEIYRAVSKVR